MQSQCERFIYNVGLCDKENLYVSCHSLTISKGAFCNLSVLLTGNLWKEMHGQRCNKSLGLLLFNNYMAVRYATVFTIGGYTYFPISETRSNMALFKGWTFCSFGKKSYIRIYIASKNEQIVTEINFYDFRKIITA